MKIFIIVGSIFPFDRLIKIVDNWAQDKNDMTIIAQIGKTNYIPQNMKYYDKLGAKEFNECFSGSDLIISHAGMGVILKSLVEQKPVIVFPRKCELNEVTTNHQIATAKALDKLNFVNIAMDEVDLLCYLENPGSIISKHKIGEFASPPLINTLKEFIENN